MKFYITMLSLAMTGVVTSVVLANPADKVGAPATQPAEAVMTRVYNVQELSEPAPEFRLAGSSYEKSFVSPAGHGLSNMYMSQQPAQTQIGLFGAQEGASATAKRHLGTEELIKLIETAVARDSWTDNGGSTGLCIENRDLLIITQTEANHQRIAALLGDMLKEQSGMVRVSADWFLLAPADAAKLIQPAVAETEEAVAPIAPAVLQNLPKGARHFSGQTLSRNGQTVYMLSGLDRSIVTSVIPVVSTGVAAYSADVSSIGGGIAFEVNSRVNWERHTALVTFASTFSDPPQLMPQSFPTPATQASNNQMTVLPPPAGIQPFSRPVQDMRSTIKLPLGMSVIAGSMTLKPDTKGADEQVLVLILKVTASR